MTHRRQIVIRPFFFHLLFFFSSLLFFFSFLSPQTHLLFFFSFLSPQTHADNGQNTGDTNSLTGKDLRQSPNHTMTGPEYGQHESYDYWMKCKTRERNKGLFTADKLQNTQNQQTSIFTRQGDNGERYGFECPEERDYYPYWHPTPWRDAIVLTVRE